MKQNNLNIVIFFFLLLAIALPEFSFSQYDSIFRFVRSFDSHLDTTEIEVPESTDQLTFDTYYWGENNEGITPSEVLFIESFNRIYIFGSRGIAVFNPITMEVETVITLCNFGQFNKFSTAYVENKFGGNQMAFDGDHILYCFTHNFEIKVIDLQINEVIESCSLSEFTDNDVVERSILKFDLNGNYLFLVVKLGSMDSRCYRFNLQNISNYFYTIIHKDIYDFEISQSHSHLFASYSEIVNHVTKYFYSVLNFSFFPVSGISAFEPVSRYGLIEYIYEPENNINKAICFPASPNGSPWKAYIFDGDTYDKTIVNLFGWHKNIQSTKYIPSEQKIYYNYNDAACDGIGIFNVNNNNVDDIFLDAFIDEYSSDIHITESKIFLAKLNRIVVIDKNYPYNWISSDYINDFILSVAGSADNVFAVNHGNCSLEIMDISGNFIESKLLGGACLNGVYNSTDNKVFMSNPIIADDNQRLFIKDLNNLTNSTIDFNEFGYGYISDVISDEPRGYVYVSIASNPFDTDAEIKIIDAETNTILPNGYSFPHNVVCRNMYMANDKLYNVLEYYSAPDEFYSKIYIIDLTNPSNTFLLSPSQPRLSGQLNAWFDQDENGNVIIALNDYGYPAHGRLIQIDNITNTISYTHGVDDPYSISYDELNKKVFFSHFDISPELGIVDLITQGVTYINLGDYCTYIVKALYRKSQNELCVLGHDMENYYSTNTKLLWINPVSLEVFDDITTQSMAISLDFNIQNGEIYTFYPRGGSNIQYLGIIPISAHMNVLFPLLNGQRPIPSTVYNPNEMFFAQDYKYLFIPNDYFSDFYKVELSPDQLTLQPRIWNWLSFPRLEREGNGTFPSVTLLEGINQFPIPLQMIHLDPESQQTIDKTYNLTQGWSGLLEDVKSSLGYKIQTQYPEIAELPMTGTILSPETTFPLFDLRPNWTGYYLTETQTPYDAIALEFQDKIGGIQGQYWYCYKEYIHTKNSGYVWRCACSQGSIELKYADMVVIHPTENIENFHWQYGGQSALRDPKNPSLFFQYNEQPEYDAIFIELDTMNRPEEIGAFAGDSCIGATTVLPTDTTVLICGYTQGFEGQEITFDLVYPTKSPSPDYDNYYVLNNQTGIREQRRIVAGEKQPYFLVSFKEKSGQVPLEESSWMTCRPDPADNEVTVSYFINEDTETSFRLINSLGSLVKYWKRGFQKAGTYDLRFGTSSFPAGYYQLEMNTGKTINMQKIIIIH